MPAAVLFDLDRTLVDRDVGWERFFVGHGLDDEERALARQHDDHGYAPRAGFAEWLAARFPHRFASAELALALALDEVPALVEAEAGAAELLLALRRARVPTAVVTNGGAGQRRKAARAGLYDLVDAFIVSGEVGRDKPDARPFEVALAALGVRAREALFVGDHPHDDVGGARFVGCRTVWLSYGRAWPAGSTPPDAVVERLLGAREVLPC